jgi:hypothetical protein
MSVSSGGSADNSSLSLSQLVALLTDPAAVAAKAAELDARQKEVQSLIDLVGPANQILQIRKDVEAVKNQTEAIVADANLKAAAIVSQAQTQARAIMDKAQSDRENLLAQVAIDNQASQIARTAAQDELSRARAASAEVEALRVQLEADRITFSTRELNLGLAQDQLEADKQDIAAKKAKLQAALAEVG